MTKETWEVLMNKGKKAAAAYFQGECGRNVGRDTNVRSTLNDLLDNILNPAEKIDEWENIEWCRWLMAGGRTPDEFTSTVRRCDNTTTCGLVWTPNFVAYRCRTCGLTPCMALCSDCFMKGNHEGHDFNMFRSLAGGACDCGDPAVMRESGFCHRHGPKAHSSKPAAPPDLMCVAEAMMPRVLLRLIQYYREKCASADMGQDPERYIGMLHQLSELGDIMRSVITLALTNPQVYKHLTDPNTGSSSATTATYKKGSHENYLKAIRKFPNIKPPPEYQACDGLQDTIVHKTFLEEFMFWMVRSEFSQKLVCFLLNLLPDLHFKEEFTRAFVLHYSRMSILLCQTEDSEVLSNRFVHVSVQLFSNEELAVKMAEEMNLLEIMLVSLESMVRQVLIPNVLLDPEKNCHMVVDCGHHVMKDHCYWPLVSDLSNVWHHRPIALKFMADPRLLDLWFQFLSYFQGMNVNNREMEDHIEFEPNTYYAAFSAEVEASATPMWNFLSHLKCPETLPHTKLVLHHCSLALQKWFHDINCVDPSVLDPMNVSFHLPLHRYYALTMSQAVRLQGASMAEVLPSKDLLKLMMVHLFRVQVAFYEIINGLWARNGLQIKGQAMTYLQCHFCNSTVDADLFLLQIGASYLDPDNFIFSLWDRFHLLMSLSLAPSNANSFLQPHQESNMLESCLTMLATIITSRNNLGLTDNEIGRLEMITQLCMADRTHSQLMELIPERCGGVGVATRNFEPDLEEVADYQAPSIMQQGMYFPKGAVWRDMYDPIHVLLRAVHRRDYQASLDRYTQYVKNAGLYKGRRTPWPPFRIPQEASPPFRDPRQLLQCKYFHGIVFVLLYKLFHDPNMSETVLAFVVYLLELALTYNSPSETQTGAECVKVENRDMSEQQDPCIVPNLKFSEWFPSDWLGTNLRHTITAVTFSDEWKYNSRDELMVSEQTEDMDVTEILDSHALLPDHPTTSSLSILPDTTATTSPTNTTSVVSMRPLNFRVRSSIDSIAGLLVPRMRVGALVHSGSSTQSRPAVTAGNEIVPMGSGGQQYVQPRSIESLRQNMKEINESIISLLLKLHSRLSGKPDSYLPPSEREIDPMENPNSRIGDGTFFIGKLLDKIGEMDSLNKEHIIRTRNSLWPCRKQSDAEERRREERRRRAKLRQERLMAQFVSRQKQFQRTLESDYVQLDSRSSASSSDAELQEDMKDLSSVEQKQEYDCVICGQSTISTETNPVGRVALLQATSVLSHRYRNEDNLILPTTEDEVRKLDNEHRQSYYMERRVSYLQQYFDNFKWQLSINIGWEGGVAIKTCGHSLHLSCHKSYQESLVNSRTGTGNLAPDRGEFYCPMCRQLSNTVLPIPPDLGSKGGLAKNWGPEEPIKDVATDLGELLTGDRPTPTKSSFMMAQAEVMDNITTKNTYPQYRTCTSVPNPQSVYLFVFSVARTNLELQLEQRGGTLVGGQWPSPSPKVAFVPLLHVLAMHSKILHPDSYSPLWSQITGLTSGDPSAVTVYEKDVPLLVRDMTSLLIQLILSLPLHVDSAYYRCIVRVLYTVVYFQAACAITCHMTAKQRQEYKMERKQLPQSDCRGVISTIGEVVDTLEHSHLFWEDGDLGCERVRDIGDGSPEQLEAALQSMCLPFLRIAALLHYHLHDVELPEISSPEQEFASVCAYLRLKGRTASECLEWCVNNPSELVHIWCVDYLMLVNRGQCAARNLLLNQHISWQRPRLLKLPKNYEKIFQFYRKRICKHCNKVPRELSVCLLCGTVVCLKDSCCRKEDNVYEAVQHSVNCGAGTAIYLAVNSSVVLVIRGKRACLWGSVYLDFYGEEDRDLKRGKPLFLSEERYSLLQEQWLQHQFDHANKRWIWHKDNL